MNSTSMFWWLDAVGSIYMAALCALWSTGFPGTPVHAYLFGISFYSVVWSLLVWVSELIDEARL